MASLELLAPEILLAILTKLDNLDTLYHLIIASPRLWRLFNQHALIITESAMSGPDCDWLLPIQVSELIRAVALIRSSRDSDRALPFRDLDTLVQKFLYQHMPRHTNLTFGPFMSLGPFVENSCDSPPPAVFRSIVFTARHITVLARDCLLFYLARLREPSFRPQHCHDPELRYTHRYGSDDDWVMAWKRVFAGEPVEVRRAADPPSWVEKMRVMRVLWLLQLVGDLKAVFGHSDASSSLPKWPVEDIDRLHSLGPEDLAVLPPMRLRAPDSLPGLEEVRSVLEYLDEICASEQDRHLSPIQSLYFRLPHPTNLRAKWDGTVEPPDPCERIWGGVGWHYDYGHRKERAGRPSPEFRKLHRVPTNSEARRRGQTRACLLEQPVGVFTFVCFSKFEESPIRGAQFDSFRKLGLAIWDQARMHGLGLIGDDYRAPIHDSFYMFAWESLLPPEEVSEVKSRLETMAGTGN